MNSLTKNSTGKSIAKWFVLAAMATAFFTVCYNTTALINALPVIASQFHININDLQWVINGYILAAVSLIALSGKLGDIFDKKKIFLFGAFGYLICSIIIALSWNQFSLIVGRTLQGIFAAFITSSSLTIIKNAFIGDELSFALGIWTALIGIGNAIGPFIGGFVTTYLGWHYLFWINTVLISFSAITTMLAIKNTQEVKQKIPVDYLGAISLTIGLFLLIFSLVKSNEWGWRDSKIFTMFAISIFALVMLKVIEKKRTYAIINFSYFKNKFFVFSCFGILLTIACSITVPYFLNFYLQNNFLLGFSPMKAGATLLPFSFSILFASLLQSRLSRKFSKGYMLSLFLMVLTLGLVGLTISSLVENLKLIFLFLVISGFGLGIITPILSSMALNIFSKQDIGQGSGLVNTILYLGDLFAVAAGSVVFFFFGSKVIQTTNSANLLNNLDNNFLVNTALIGDKANSTYLPHLPNFEITFPQLAQHAAKIAFSSVIIFTIITLIIYTLFSFCFLSKINE